MNRQSLASQSEVVLNNLPSAVLIIEGGTIVSANAVANQWFGKSQKGIVGNLLSDVLPEEEIRRYQAFQTVKPQSAEHGYWNQLRDMELNAQVYRW